MSPFFKALSSNSTSERNEADRALDRFEEKKELSSVEDVSLGLEKSTEQDPDLNPGALTFEEGMPWLFPLDCRTDDILKTLLEA